MNLRQSGIEALAALIREEFERNPQPGEHIIRCAPGSVPFYFPVVARRAPARTDAQARAEDDLPAPQRDVRDDQFIVQGTASSTSIDWHGTEMSAACLADMERQFNDGVDLFPRHGGFLDSVEWDEVLGRTFMAGVQQADVANPADVREMQFVLKIQALVNKRAPKASDLEARLDDEQQIGLSIGGWFVEVRYITDADGELSRIIIERVDLDHVAVVRAPSNPDSIDLKILRDAAMHAARSPLARHIMRITDDGENIVIAFAKGGEMVAEPEEEEDPDTEGRSADEVTAQVQQSASYPPSEDAREGQPGDPPDNRSNPMNEQMDKILAALGEIQASQRKDSERLDALEARMAPPASPKPAEPVIDTTDTLDIEDIVARAVTSAIGAQPKPDPDAEALRARIAELEAERDNRDAVLADLAVSRVGMARKVAPSLGGNTDTEQAGRDIDLLIQRAKADGDHAPMLCAVVQRAKNVLTISRSRDGRLPTGEEGRKVMRAAHEAPEVLRGLLVAAERDGLIGNFSTGWR